MLHLKTQGKAFYQVEQKGVDMAEKVLKAGIYARVSTDKQDTDMQMTDLRRLCELKKMEIYKEYIDTGFSGSKESRPALDELMDDALKCKFDVVLVWKFDRFARSSMHLMKALEQFNVKGVQFISYTENIDTGTSMGQAMFTIIGAMAQLERDIIRERVRAGIRRAKEKGVKFGRKSLNVDPKDVIYLRDTEKLSIRQIAKRTGVSSTQIYRILSSLKDTGSRSQGGNRCSKKPSDFEP